MSTDRRHRSGLASSLFLFLASGTLLLVYYQYPGLDLISYVSVARKYATGDLVHAVNGCWGPLGSWLLVPFLWTGVEPIFGYRLIALAIGALTLLGVWLLSHRFESNDRIRRLVLPIAAVWMLSFSYVPDLLLVCILVYYLYLVFDPNFADRTYGAAMCGALGGLAYLSKGYGLPFFLMHFTAFAILRLVRGEGRRAVLRDYGVGVLVCALIAGPWVAALSHKYGRFTVNTAFSYTYAVLGPDSEGHPVFNGFLEPPDPAAISAMDDPSLIEVEPWSPFETWRNFTFQLRLIVTNLVYLLGIYTLFSPLSVAIATAVLVLCLPLRRGIRHPLFLPLLTFLIFPAGYLPTQLTEQAYFLRVNSVGSPELGRYVWINAILLLLMGGACLHLLLGHRYFDRSRRLLVLLVFSGSFLLFPALTIYRAFTMVPSVYAIAEDLPLDEFAGRVAASDHLHRSRYLAYRMGCQFYGVKAPAETDEELQRDLERFDIDYYLSWRGDPGDRPEPAFLRLHREVSHGRFPELRIYALKRSL